MRNKITLLERLRFLTYTNKAISKLNTRKNREKPHHTRQSFRELSTHQVLESIELSEAIRDNEGEKRIIDECYDNINIPLMIIDKFRK